MIIILEMLTSVREAEFIADNIGILIIPGIITHCPPFLVVTNLHSTTGNAVTSHKPHIAIKTHCSMNILIISP
jgi:hypothetical protein